ncbi:MAG: SLBB domain-containing protein [Candidatus Binataceae bacterium]
MKTSAISIEKLLKITAIATALLLVAGAATMPALAQDQMPGASVESAASQLSVTPDQLSQFQSSYASGGISPQQMQDLCSRVAAKHLSQQDVAAMANSMGLSADDTARLSQCAAEGGPPNVGQAGHNDRLFNQSGKNPSLRLGQENTAKNSAFTPNSEIEERYHDLSDPFRARANPSPNRLEQFGYSVFSQDVSTFAPVGNVPVSDDYLVGPGDSLTVLLWGRMNQTLNLPVQRDGTIMMPHIGPIPVAGLSFGQSKKLIESRAGQIEGVQVSVTMGSIRTIQVFVLGKVKQPGLYTVSALSHISNALVAAGGLTKVGSLRKVELRRGNHTIEDIDLYGMLLHGDDSRDIRLEPRDVIFVPVIGPVVGLTGDVNSPGIYELRGETGLRSVLQLAGGVSAFGYAQRLQVERIDNHQRQIALDVNFTQLGSQRFAIRDGDLVKVFPVLPQQRNVVVLKGNVNRPGSYQWYQGMRVSDLVREGEGIADHTFLDYASIRRRVGMTNRVQYVPIDLNGALDGETDPGNLTLTPRDELTVYSNTDLKDVPTAKALGAVRRPGLYALTQGMKVSDLVFEAGGLKDDAYQKRATLARSEVVAGSTAKHTYEDVDLTKALAPGSTDDPELIRGDELFVQEASNWHRPWQVKVVGEVMRPGPYPIHEGERLASLLDECGGLRSDGYLPAIVMVRQSVKEVEQKRLDESRLRLEQDIARLSLAPRQAGQSAKIDAAALAAMQKALDDAHGHEAVGRIALNATTLGSLAGSPSDVVLEEGDTLTIPKRPASVNVLGQVYDPVAIVYQPELRVKDYLERAGGPTESADADHIFVIKANGSIMTDKSYRDMERSKIFPLMPLVSGGLMDAYLDPGDTVFVPEQLVVISGLQYATDVTQIIANSAMGLAVMGILATSL